MVAAETNDDEPPGMAQSPLLGKFPGYCLVSELGSGKYGSVYLARSSDAPERLEDPLVAVKVSPTRSKAAQSLKAEQEILEILQGHDCVPQLYRFHKASGFDCLVMNLLGPSLEQAFARQPFLYPQAVLMSLGNQLINILRYIHSRWIAHCDVKPGNIVLGRGPNGSKRVRIIDFGLARMLLANDGTLADGEPKEGRFTGTRAFASLHAHQGYMPSRRDDIESLSYSLLYLRTGRLPWRDLVEHADHIRAKATEAVSQECGANTPWYHLFNHARRLGYKTKPDYHFLCELMSMGKSSRLVESPREDIMEDDFDGLSDDELIFPGNIGELEQPVPCKLWL